jgi:hypothetical protein
MIPAQPAVSLARRTMRRRELPSVTDTLFAITTHKFDRAICRNIDRVCNQLGRDYKVIVYHDATSAPDARIPPLDCPVVSFDFKKIRTKFPHLSHANIIPGNKHAAFIDLLPVFPAIEYFWFVEYDVRFSGNWRTLVDTCRRSDADMLGCHIRTREEIPDWYWWPSIKNANDPKRQLPGVRAFAWASRFSRRALDIVARRCIEEGWTGHMEGLVPSLLQDAGMRLEEIGGQSPFTPQDRSGLFYSSEYGSSVPSPSGDYGLGSNRYAPPLLFWGTKKDRIYHPVKTDRGLIAIKRDLRSLVAHKWHSSSDLFRRVGFGHDFFKGVTRL